MLSQTEKKVVAAFIAFLRDKLDSNQLEDDSAESADVALQCLVTAFSDINESALKPLPPLQDLCQKWEADRVVNPEEERRAEDLKTEGNELMKGQKFDEALVKYTEALQIRPSPVYHCNRAAAYTKLERYSEAMADCRSALALDPAHSKAYARMGLIHSSKLEHKEAVTCYKNAVDLEPENVSYKNNLNVAEQKVSEAQGGGIATPGGPGNQGTGVGGMPGFGGIPGFGALGGDGGMPDMSSILGNPALMNMATQIMSNPEMQNMMASMMGGAATTGGGGVTGGTPQAPQPNMQNLSSLLEAGQQMASQMQQQNPELVEQLRQQFLRNQQGGGTGPGSDQGPDGNPDNPPPDSQNGP